MVFNWFDTVKGNPLVHKDLEGNLYYKGFKVTPEGEISDIRFFDFYRYISDDDMEIIKDLGIVDGATKIMYLRDIERRDKYAELIKNYRANIRNFRSSAKKYRLQKKSAIEMGEDVDRYNVHIRRLLKRVRNTNKVIDKYKNLTLFYNARIIQYEEKEKNT